MIKSLRILIEIGFPDKTVRLYDGVGGPFMDSNGNIWRSCVITDDGINAIESGINGQAISTTITLSGLDKDISGIAWKETDGGDVIGSTVRIIIQECNEYEQPINTPRVEAQYTIEDLTFNDISQDNEVSYTVTAVLTNRFTLRALINGGVLSDTEQRLRSQQLNPSAPADRFAERITGLNEKSIDWPRYT